MNRIQKVVELGRKVKGEELGRILIGAGKKYGIQIWSLPEYHLSVCSRVKLREPDEIKLALKAYLIGRDKVYDVHARKSVEVLLMGEVNGQICGLERDAEVGSFELCWASRDYVIKNRYTYMPSDWMSDNPVVFGWPLGYIWPTGDLTDLVIPVFPVDTGVERFPQVMHEQRMIEPEELRAVVTKEKVNQVFESYARCVLENAA